ncbi:MAG TPA: hypothetical protein VGO47_13870, partial [Chlamydiales bacterium]|nr:hypothetical protein [Chlamydiales bacterium]
MQSFSLIVSSDYKTACDLITSERDHFRALSSEPTATTAANAGLKYLAYLESTWMPEALWRSWSQLGRIQASQRLNIPVNKIATTTNHLEAFNGVLKRKLIYQFQKGNHRLRF